MMRLGYVVLWICTTLVTLVVKSDSKACDGYIPCKTDKDCWNGPGYHCEPTVDTEGKPTAFKVCVCGGDRNITEPDGILRQFFCTFDGYHTNGIRLCLVKGNYPCWPTEDEVDHNIDGKGLGIQDITLNKAILNTLRNVYCGHGVCGASKDDNGNHLCTEMLGNYFQRKH